MILIRCKRRRSMFHRHRFNWRAIAWAGLVLAIVFPTLAAYQPAFMLGSNNLSEITSASSARSNLGLGTAAVKAASGSGGTVASVTGSFTINHIATFADTAGTVQDGGSANPGYSVSKFTGSLPTTVSSTVNVTTVSSMGTPAAGTYNLPASHAAGWRGCIKDGATNFASNAATVKGPSGNIYANSGAVAATTGVVMNMQGEEFCFLDDGTDYYVE